MDVVMLRADYERLIAGFDEWKSSDRFSLAWYRDGKSIYSFVKLVDTTTRVLENFVDKKTSTGVWVDIFPLEDLKPYRWCAASSSPIRRWGRAPS